MLVVAAAPGLVAGVTSAFFGPWQVACLGGWDAAAATYLGWIWASIWGCGPPQTAQLAEREDPTRPLADLLVLAAAAASLLGVALVVIHAKDSKGGLQIGYAALNVASVVVSWAMVHTTYTLRYARLYYTGPDGGVTFNGRRAPQYSDFAYLAFTIGMTFQVSDTALTTREFRATALRHALLSYLFGAVIIAATINLVVGLGR